MSQRVSLPEVFSAREIARAAGVGEAEVRALIEAGAIRTIPTGGRRPLVAHAEAVRAGRLLAAGLLAGAVPDAAGARTLFRNEPGAAHAARAPFAISGAAHACLVGAVVLATTFGLGSTAQTTTAPARAAEPLQLVYLALPGPGGGGGGGGLRRPAPPPRAERKGHRAISSPLPDRTPKPQPAVKPAEPDPRPQEPLPEVVAAVATAPADDRDRAGVLEDAAADDSRGPGEGGGTGTGRGTGIGEGDGSGLGDGSGGGTGGGPYRPGSGIDPPALVREVRPDYTEEARQRGVEGDVLMEIVVRHDGTVGEVRVLQGLGHGLDARAVQAVRQWRFEPARRHGRPVDVLVEVAMEFKIR